MDDTLNLNENKTNSKQNSLKRVMINLTLATFDKTLTLIRKNIKKPWR